MRQFQEYIVNLENNEIYPRFKYKEKKVYFILLKTVLNI